MALAFTYVLNNLVALIDPRGLSANRVTRTGATDNECFSTAGGLFQGYVVNAQCLDMATGGQIIFVTVETRSAPPVFSRIVFARPPRGGSRHGGSVLDQLDRDNPGPIPISAAI